MIPILEKNIPINKVITSLNLILLYIINFWGLFSLMNISYLFITHDLAPVSSSCDRVAVMKNGKVVEVGDAKEVINNPMDEYTKLLIKSAYF